MGRGGADTLKGVGLKPCPARVKVREKRAFSAGRTRFATPSKTHKMCMNMGMDNYPQNKRICMSICIIIYSCMFINFIKYISIKLLRF